MNINEILDQIERGLEGVTPGPWRVRIGPRDDQDECHRSVCGDIFVLADFNGPQYPHQAQNAAHIARCDPGTMRAIIDAYRAMEARAEAAEAKVARLMPLGNHLHNLIQICAGVPISGVAAEQAVDAARAALKAMENTDE